MKKIAMTGATSMLGVALINECIMNGIMVLAIINPDSVNRSRIPKSDLVQTLECRLEDLANTKVINGLSDRAWDVFYHFGWTGTSKLKRLDVNEQSANILFTLDAVRLARKLGCQTFIGAGSQAEYGRVSIDKISPDTPVHPDIAYGVAKYAAGRMSAILCEQLSIRHIWARIFSVYGPYDNNASMVMYCINTLLKQLKPSFTKCEQIWDYLYSEDAALAFRLIGEKGQNRSIYCIGSGDAKPLADYIEIIRDTINSRLDVGIGELPYSPNQVMHLCADIESLKNDTGFEPKYSFKQGITKTINWMNAIEK